MNFEKIRKVINDKLLEKVYLLALLIYTIKFITKFSLIIDLPNTLSDPIYNTVFILLLFKVIFQRYDRKSFIITILILILGYATYYFDPTRNLKVLPLILVGVKDCDIKKVVKVIFVITVAFIVIHTIGYFVDHYMNYHTFSNLPLFYRHYDGRSTVLCKYNNSYGAIGVMGIMQYLYLCDREKNRYQKMVILFLLLFIFYAIGTSRTSTILGVLAVLYLPLQSLPVFKNNLRTIKIFVFVVVFVLSIGMMFLNFDNSFVLLLDGLLSGRVELSIAGYSTYGISLLPQLAEMYANPIVLDNCVVYLLLSYGLVLFTCLMLIVIYLSILTKCDDITDYLLIIVFIWALTEHTPTFVVLTITPLLVLHNYYRRASKQLN